MYTCIYSHSTFIHTPISCWGSWYQWRSTRWFFCCYNILVGHAHSRFLGPHANLKHGVLFAGQRQPQTFSSTVSQGACLGKVHSHWFEQWEPQPWLCGDRWPIWQSCWHSCAVLCVFAQAALHSAKRGVHGSDRSHPELQRDSLSIFTLIPIWKISHLMMISSPRKRKHEMPVASGLPLSFLWHFHPENT